MTNIKERPILFSAEMVTAIGNGWKNCTRRIMKPQPSSPDEWGNFEWRGFFVLIDHIRRKCKYGQPGDRLWVKESWQVWHEFNGIKPTELPEIARQNINYPANGNLWDARIRPSIHMPRWASRITLEITDVWVEHLQDISEEEARREGVADRAAFAELWDGLNAKPGLSWEDNPWVWVIGFRRI